jgi:LysM repeat protein
VADGEETASGDPLMFERASGPFRTNPLPDVDRPRSICRFLAFEAADGTLAPATGGVDAANGCVAIGEPVPQSARQQELVCVVAAHVNCPRFLRGVILAGTPAPPPRREPVSPAVIGASLVLAAALAVSFGFLAVRGGFNVPVGSPSPVAVAAVGSSSPSPVPPASASSAPSEVPSPSPSPSPSASPSPSPSPIVTPGPSPTPNATPNPTRTPAPPKPTPTATATSDRFALLTKCPSTTDCWIYVIRAGDNLQSIANWFGVSYDRILQMNPWITDPTSIHAGQHLRIPTPTR